jgi:hypothetical protein
MPKIQLLDPQQSLRFRKSVLSYLISVSPRSLYARQIESHFDEYMRGDVGRALRWLCKYGLARQMASLYYATDKGKEWAKRNIRETAER